jgi:YbbR domain-containing protein
VKFLRILTDNFGWKLLSLMISFGLWLIFVGETEMGASVSVPVHYLNLPKNMEITSEPVDHLYLKVRGPSRRITSSTMAEAAVVLDLGNISKPGEQTFNLGASNVELPAGISLVQAIPSQIQLKFEPYASAEVPVQARFAGAPPAGYRVVGQNISPPTIRISGPQSKVSRIASVVTDLIDLKSTYSTTEFRVSANIPDPQLRIESSPNIEVRVSIEKIPVTQD